MIPKRCVDSCRNATPLNPPFFYCKAFKSIKNDKSECYHCHKFRLYYVRVK